ncbi:MAG: alpha-glucuronidase, partial [Cyclobacteriaceae bacterium]|nr:alpha-glucuronidase [Cyclobacteriaceae bacterium]
VKWMQQNWQSLKGKVDQERFEEVASLLALQYEEASIWRDACVLYFQTFSKRPIPSTLPTPKHSLEYYKKLTYPYAPGIKSEW